MTFVTALVYQGDISVLLKGEFNRCTNIYY